MIGWLFSPSPARARAAFERERASLQEAFFALAAGSGKPRGLRWKSMDWQPATEFARDKPTRKLVMLVGVVIAFEAIEGGDMEGVEAVGNLREASALFVFDKGKWTPTGRTLFNLAPADVLARFAAQYERVSG
ncbi:MAG: hypothetical protein K2W96_14560 [Gemmataceae bacterium]|nr:hypothetical protein [Gemmataceae bacterium]